MDYFKILENVISVCSCISYILALGELPLPLDGFHYPLAELSSKLVHLKEEWLSPAVCNWPNT